MGFALDQLDTHTVGAGQVGNTSAWDKFVRLNRKCPSFFPDCMTEIDQVTNNLKTKMIRAPLVVTYKGLKMLQGILVSWMFSGSLSSDEDGRAGKLHRNLGSAPYLTPAHDRAP